MSLSRWLCFAPGVIVLLLAAACGDDDSPDPYPSYPRAGTGGSPDAPSKPGGFGGWGGAGGTGGSAGAPVEPGPAKLELVTTFGGGATAAAVVNQIAYVAVGRRLVSYDLSTPDTPTEREASAPLDGPVLDLAIRLPHVFALTRHSLTVMRVEANGAFAEVGKWPMPEEGFASSPGVLTLAGSLAFVAGSSLQIVNVADPTQPRTIGTYAPPGIIRASTVASDRVYLGVEASSPTPDSRVEIIDVADPSLPHLVSTIATDDSFLRDLAVTGNRLYVAQDTKLDIYDLTAQGTPTLLGTAPSSYGSLQIAGDHVYAHGNEGLVEIDLSDPAAPVESTVYSDYNISHVVFDGSLALAWPGDGVPLALDLTEASPSPHQLPNISGYVEQVEQIGDRLVVRTATRLEMYEGPSAGLPRPAASIELPNETVFSPANQRFTIVNGHVVVPVVSGLRAFDPALSLAELLVDPWLALGSPEAVVGSADRERAFVHYHNDGADALSEWRVTNSHVEYVKEAGRPLPLSSKAFLVRGYFLASAFVPPSSQIVSYSIDQFTSPVDVQIPFETGYVEHLFADPNQTDIFASSSNSWWWYRLSADGRLKPAGSGGLLTSDGQSGYLQGITPSGLAVVSGASLELRDPHAAQPFDTVAVADHEYGEFAAERGDLLYVSQGNAGIAVFRVVPPPTP